MPQLTPLTIDTASGASKDLLTAVKGKIGMVPNLYATIAHSPETFGAFLGFQEALGKGKLSPQVREKIALASAGANGCGYCASAHSAIGKMVGLEEGEISKNLAGASDDPKTEAALSFVRAVIRERGFVAEGEIAKLREAGFGNDEIVEIFGNTVLNIFTNYFNNIVGTDIDFPRVDISGVKRAA